MATNESLKRDLAKRDEAAEPNKSVRRMLNDMASEFGRVLPREIGVSRFIRTALTVVNSDNRILKADPTSLLASLQRCAELGLMPGRNDAQAYLVAFWNSKRGCYEVNLIPGYQGYIELMHRAGIGPVEAHLVYEADDFEYVIGDDGKFQHRPNFKVADRGSPWLAYAFAWVHSDRRSKVVTFNRAEAEEVRDRFSQSYANKKTRDDSPWVTDFEAMWLKGLALDTPLPTPDGWTTMAKINVGDTVFDRKGRPTRVTAASEIKHLKCYRMDFRSGPPIVCDSEHLWIARVGQTRERTCSVDDLYRAKQERRSVTVPIAGSIQTAYRQLPIDPWVLGYWLGNGDADAGRVTAHGDDANEVVAAVLSAGYRVGAVRRDPRGNAVRIGINGISKALADLGMLANKHVPEGYLRASPEQRMALLRGLMDSDGSVWRRTVASRVRFSTTTPELRDAVAELARSLGEQVLLVDHDGFGYGHRVRVFAVSWTTSVMPFALSRKAAATKVRVVHRDHSIYSVDRIPTVPTRCIAVDSPTRSYLAGEAMIPTHNTPVRELRKWVPTSSERLELLGSYDDDVVTDAVSNVVDPSTDVVDGEVVEEEQDWPEVTHAPARPPRGRRIAETPPADDIDGQMTIDDLKQQEE